MDLQYINILGEVVREEWDYEKPCGTCGALTNVSIDDGKVRSASRCCKPWCSRAVSMCIDAERRMLREQTRRVVKNTRARWAVR